MQIWGGIVTIIESIWHLTANFDIKMGKILENYKSTIDLKNKPTKFMKNDKNDKKNEQTTKQKTFLKTMQTKPQGDFWSQSLFISPPEKREGSQTSVTKLSA